MEIDDTLTRIWSDVLDVDTVDPNTNFFEIGGDSLAAVRVITMARRAGLRLSQTEFDENPTIAGQVPLLAARTSGSEGGGPQARPKTSSSRSEHDGETRAPLLPVQERFFEWRVDNRHTYTLAVALDVAGPANEQTLQRAVRALVERHDALRSRFPVHQGRRRCQLLPLDEASRLHVHDLSQARVEDAERAMRDEMEALRQGISLESGPLLNVVLFRLAQGRSRLVLQQHHLLVDGLSLAIIAEDLTGLYAAALNGTDPKLQEAESAVEHSRALRELANGPQAAGLLRAWLQRPWSQVGELVGGDPSGSLALENVVSVEHNLEPSATAAFLRSRVEYGVSGEEVLLSALAAALADEASTRTVVVDVCRHGRTGATGSEDLSRSVGWLATVAPYVLAVPSAQEGDGGAVLAALAPQIRDSQELELSWGALKYLSEDPEVNARLAALARPDVYLNYRGVGMRTPPWGAPFELVEYTGPRVPGSGEQQYPVKIWAEVIDGRLNLVWSFSAARYPEDLLKRVADNTMSWLSRMLTS